MPTITVDLGDATEKQKLLYEDKHRHVLYGGARGGGKSHAARCVAITRCIINPGYRVAIFRETYSEVMSNFWRPLCEMIPDEICSKNKTSLEFEFWNGSYIKLCNYSSEDSMKKYQGIEVDLLIIDEACNFSPRTITYLNTMLRAGKYKFKQAIYTCNPIGPSKAYFKRLFVDKEYITDSENPEENEDASQYNFISCTVDDNPYLDLADYTRALAQLPEDIRNASRYGDWETNYGSYFSNFIKQINTCEPFEIPSNWPKYRSIDFGLDMLAVTWAAIDNDGRIWIYRTFQESGLTISQACEKIKELTGNEPIVTTYLPPDLYARSKESGRSLVEIWCENGIYSTKADNNRITGHRIIRNMFSPIFTSNEFTRDKCNGREEAPMLMIFNNNYKLIEDLQAIQADKKNSADCSKTPHEITHSVDSLRYLVISHNFTPLDGESMPILLSEEDWDTESAFAFYKQDMVTGFTLKSFIT